MPLTPDVSICVPTFNHEQTVGRCLESALAVGDQSMEVVVLDDCSSDRTWEIACGFDDARLRCIRNQRNVGAAANHNRCLAAARGDRIVVLHGDDRLDGPGVSRLIEAQRDANAALYFGRRAIEVADADESAARWKARFEAIERPLVESVPATREAHQARRFVGSEVVRFHLSRDLANFIGEPSNVMFDRGLALRLGGFRPEVQQWFDLDLWLRLLSHGDAILVPGIVATRYMHGDTLTVSNLARRRDWLDRLYLLRALMNESIDLESDPELQQWMTRLRRRAVRDWLTGVPGPRRSHLGPLCRALYR